MFKLTNARVHLSFRSSLHRLALATSVALIATACSNVTENTAFLKSLLPDALSADSVAQAQSATQSDWETTEREIIAEHSRVRQSPQSYIPILEAYLATMNAQGEIPGGGGPNCTLVTQEGRSAVEEAIAFLRSQPAVGPLEYSADMASAAKSHAQDQRGGEVGHVGSDGSRGAQRLEQFGVENSGSGENIDYGSSSAKGVLMSLIIDDGVADRGHRTNLFSPDWTTAGAGCGSHATYRTVCVVNYAKISRELSVTNNGTVDLLSLQVAGADILGGPLAVGTSRTITIPESQNCEANVVVQMGGRYASLTWNNVSLCGAAMTIDPQNSLTLSY
ncbi:MAG: CAP domain-containing protein [Phormidesmis sp.]